MKNKVDTKQKSAIILGEQLAQEIITNSEVAETFLDSIKKNPLNQTHANIVKEVLPNHPKINVASDEILRTAARTALKILLTEDKYQETTSKAHQRGGDLRKSDLHTANGTTILNDAEKEMLDQIGKKAEGYKRNTIRDIKKIQAKLVEAGHPMRGGSAIYEYLKHFQNSIKKVISRQEHPEETADLEKLFQKYYIPGERLPRRQITEELNAMHHHNRSEESIGKYIKDNFKTQEERAAMTSEIRPDDEQEFIRNIIKNQKEYRYPANIRSGGYNLNKIANEFLAAFPDRKRGKRGIKHQIERQRKLITEKELAQHAEDTRKMKLLIDIMIGMSKGRTGRENRGVEPEYRETIAMHSGKVKKAAQLFCLAHPELKLDFWKMSMMGLLHDIAEYKEKDYVPGEIPKEEKYKREKAVIVTLVPDMGEEVLLLREEFEKGESPEAVILQQLDKLDAAVRALEYERQGYTEHKMEEFYPYTMSKLKHPDLIKIFNILLKKKYNHINCIDQYYLLLKCNGNEEYFDKVMLATEPEVESEEKKN